MGITTVLIIVGAGVVAVGLAVFALAKQYVKVGPNEVLIISGGRQRWVEIDGERRRVGYRIIIGGGAFLTPFVETAQSLPLETYTVTIKTPEVLTRGGVHLIAEARAQVKVASNEVAIMRAAEQFLGRGASAIREVAETTLEGYMRSALGAMSVEEIYQNRDSFNRRVRQEASADFARMGLELLSFNLGDISDTQGYIAALGTPRIVQVKRDAAVAQAESERDTAIKTAQARKEGEIARFQVETEIALASHDYELKRAALQSELNRRRAETDIAYDLERQRQAAELKKAEYQTRLVEKEAAIRVEQEEIKRRELELEATVRKPAEAHKYQVELEAEAERIRLAAEAKGRAEARLSEGTAEVEVKKAEGLSRIEYTRKLGQAEAEAMTAKAAAFKSYNEAAIYQMFVEKLPELARAVAEPLSKVDKIVMVGDGASGASKLTGQVAQVLAQIPEVVQAVSGIDLKQVLAPKAGQSKEGTDK